MHAGMYDCASAPLDLTGLVCCREVLKLLTEDQLDRYEAFRRSSLSKISMKKVCVAPCQSGQKAPPTAAVHTSSEWLIDSVVAQLLHNATGHPPNPNTTIVMCGITKLFVGDLIETGAFCTAASSYLACPSASGSDVQLKCLFGDGTTAVAHVPLPQQNPCIPNLP